MQDSRNIKSTTARRACILGAMALSWLATAAAQDIADGTLAAAIRGSGHACEHVIDKQPAGESVWNVRCNSGRFQVTMTDTDNPQVVKLD